MAADAARTIKPVLVMDLTGTRCPITFARARTALDLVDPGQAIELILRVGEQMQEVPGPLKEEGHRIVDVRREEDGYHLVIVKCGADGARGRGCCCEGGVCGPAEVPAPAAERRPRRRGKRGA